MIATARNTSSITELADLGIECLSLEVDKPEEVERCMREVEALLGDGALDYLVNNAGRSRMNSCRSRLHDGSYVA